MLSQLISRHLTDDFKLLTTLKLYYTLLNLVITDLLIEFATLPYCFADLIKPTYNIFCDLEFEAVDVLVLYIFNGSADEIFINTLAKKRTGLQHEPHLLLSQELSG